MSEENREGVGHLLALKRSSQADAASAPGENADPDAPELHGEPHHGGNKRQARRYKCEGSVEMRTEGCDVRTWATFTDISLYGCYIEAQATFPAGTVLNLKLEADGIRVETRGNVRVNYPYLGMGVAFVGMTGENVGRLRRILASASRGCVVEGMDVGCRVAGTEGASGTPVIAEAAAVIRDLMEFFENHETLGRKDFVRMLHGGQSAAPRE
ncbi:MAG TPA: PilZ domain-containing protein [Candidatus Sulfotelmatobacter sp.]